MAYIGLAITAIFASNIILSQFWGICPFLGVSKSPKNALGMAAALLFVVVMSSFICWGLNALLVLLELEYLKLVVFILVIASFVQFLEFFMKKFLPSLYKALGIYLPLITTNCVVLTVVQNIASDAGSDFWYVLIYSLSVPIGYGLVLILFSYIRQRIDNQEMPKAFKGTAIALITASLMALSFLAFAGM